MSKFNIDREMIRELAALLEETGLGEIEAQDGERRIRVARPAPMAVLSIGAGSAMWRHCLISRSVLPAESAASLMQKKS